MQPSRKILFEVLPLDGLSRYVIYTNGETEGFPRESVIVNYHPVILARERMVLQREIETRQEGLPPTSVARSTHDHRIGK